jgi:hypothetical protein
MTLWLRIVNAALYLAACSLVATGLALEWKVEIEDEGRSLLGMTGEDWGEVHFILALVVMALAVTHIALHWAWIKNTLTRLRWPTLACLAAGLVVIAVVLIAPVTGAGAGGDAQGQSERQPDND